MLKVNYQTAVDACAAFGEGASKKFSSIFLDKHQVKDQGSACLCLFMFVICMAAVEIFDNFSLYRRSLGCA